MLQISIPRPYQLSTYRIQTKAYAALQTEDILYTPKALGLPYHMQHNCHLKLYGGKEKAEDFFFSLPRNSAL